MYGGGACDRGEVPQRCARRTDGIRGTRGTRCGVPAVPPVPPPKHEKEKEMKAKAKRNLACTIKGMHIESWELREHSDGKRKVYVRFIPNEPVITVSVKKAKKG